MVGPACLARDAPCRLEGGPGSGLLSTSLLPQLPPWVTRPPLASRGRRPRAPTPVRTRRTPPSFPALRTCHAQKPTPHPPRAHHCIVLCTPLLHGYRYSIPPPLISALRPRFHALLSHTPMPCHTSDPHAASQLAKPLHACRLPASSSPSAPAAPKTFGHAPRRAANAYFLAASTHAPPLMNSIYPCATLLYFCATAPPPRPCMPHLMQTSPDMPCSPRETGLHKRVLPSSRACCLW